MLSGCTFIETFSLDVSTQMFLSCQIWGQRKTFLGSLLKLWRQWVSFTNNCMDYFIFTRKTSHEKKFLCTCSWISCFCEFIIYFSMKCIWKCENVFFFFFCRFHKHILAFKHLVNENVTEINLICCFYFLLEYIKKHW